MSVVGSPPARPEDARRESMAEEPRATPGDACRCCITGERAARWILSTAIAIAMDGRGTATASSFVSRGAPPVDGSGSRDGNEVRDREHFHREKREGALRGPPTCYGVPNRLRGWEFMDEGKLNIV